MFLYGRLAVFFGLSLSVMTLFAAPNVQAQMLLVDELPGSQPTPDQPKQGDFSGIALNFMSPNISPILYDQTPFKSMDRSAFTPKANDFLWTLPVKLPDPKSSVNSIQTSGERACFPVASSPGTTQASILPTAWSDFSLSLSTDCISNTVDIADIVKTMAGLMKIADLQEKIAVFRFGGDSEKVPEPTVSAAIWLGITAVGALSTQFKSTKQ